jgi:ligand-binding SRPBCC domain-containing protein
MKRVLQYNTEQLLPVVIEEAWNFFSTPKNLVLITPPDLDFRILTKLDDGEIYPGMTINYMVRPLFGIPVRWQTEICEVNKPFSFTDRQVSGPYKTWIHRHEFIEKDNGVLMKDEVRYELPLGLVGNIGKWLVQNRVEKIFAYRRQILQRIFKP